MLRGVALREESVDRNFGNDQPFGLAGWSLSARRAWIEIFTVSLISIIALVALREESVDRNFIGDLVICRALVALREESVDRNIRRQSGEAPQYMSLSARRAWIEISDWYTRVLGGTTSLSARRAWIEIVTSMTRMFFECRSLSARRAWIEIATLGGYVLSTSTSLSARRAWIEIRTWGAVFQAGFRRSPRGERG